PLAPVPRLTALSLPDALPASEAASHLSTIRGWLDRSATVPQPADDALQRAIHTLNGALAMTEVPVITEITSPAEAYVRRLLASGQPATAEGVGAMEAVSEAVARTLATLESDQPRVPLFPGLAERMEALRDSLPPVRPSALEAGGGDDDAAAEAVIEAPAIVDIDMTGLGIEAGAGDVPVVEEDPAG